MNNVKKIVECIVDSEAIRYIFFGVITTLVNIISYMIFNYIGIPYIISNLMAFILSVIFAFLTNKVYVFNSKSWGMNVLLREGISFLGARLTTFIIDMALLIIMVERLEINDFISKCLVNVVVIILNYILSKLIIFRR